MKYLQIWTKHLHKTDGQTRIRYVGLEREVFTKHVGASSIDVTVYR